MRSPVPLVPIPRARSSDCPAVQSNNGAALTLGNAGKLASVLLHFARFIASTTRPDSSGHDFRRATALPHAASLKTRAFRPHSHSLVTLEATPRARNTQRGAQRAQASPCCGRKRSQSRGLDRVPSLALLRHLRPDWHGIPRTAGRILCQPGFHSEIDALELLTRVSFPTSRLRSGTPSDPGRARSRLTSPQGSDRRARPFLRPRATPGRPSRMT